VTDQVAGTDHARIVPQPDIGSLVRPATSTEVRESGETPGLTRSGVGDGQDTADDLDRRSASHWVRNDLGRRPGPVDPESEDLLALTARRRQETPGDAQQPPTAESADERDTGH
jgi:hypothetical protein